MYQILDRITRREGKPSDIDLLEDLAIDIEDASLCALGGTAPNLVLSTLRYFREEYEAHVMEKRCPAGVCRSLIIYEIDANKCTGCTACAKKCPVKAILGTKKEPHKIDLSKCVKCGICADTCKFDAIVIK